MLTVVVLAQFAVIAYLVFMVYKGYRAEQGTVWEKFVAGFRSSLTIFWGWINAISVSAVSLLVLVSQALDTPGIKESITPYMKPEYMLIYVLVVSVGSMLARSRTL